MNKLWKHHYFIVAAVCILSLIISLGNSRQALAAQNVADLSVTVVADKARAKIGENITYTVTATNLGPDPAILVSVNHGLPDQLNFVSLSCDRGISSDGTSCEYLTLEPGESVVSTLVTTPNPSAQNHERDGITTAAVSLEVDCNYDPANCTLDPNSGNNLASVTVKLIGRLQHP